MEDSKCANSTPQAAGEKRNPAPVTAVMGIGNLLLRDEGIGIHVIRKLKEIVDPDEVELIDAGTVPDIFSLVQQHIEKLIVIDAAAGNDKPGTIYRLNGNEIKANPAIPVSLHDIGLAENLSMLSLLNPDLKSVTVIGIQVGDISFGLEPNVEVKAKIPEIIQMVLAEIGRKDNLRRLTHDTFRIKTTGRDSQIS